MGSVYSNLIQEAFRMKMRKTTRYQDAGPHLSSVYVYLSHYYTLYFLFFSVV